MDFPLYDVQHEKNQNRSNLTVYRLEAYWCTEIHEHFAGVGEEDRYNDEHLLQS